MNKEADMWLLQKLLRYIQQEHLNTNQMQKKSNTKQSIQIIPNAKICFEPTPTKFYIEKAALNGNFCLQSSWWFLKFPSLTRDFFVMPWYHDNYHRYCKKKLVRNCLHWLPHLCIFIAQGKYVMYNKGFAPFK